MQYQHQYGINTPVDTIGHAPVELASMSDFHHKSSERRTDATVTTKRILPHHHHPLKSHNFNLQQQQEDDDNDEDDIIMYEFQLGNSSSNSLFSMTLDRLGGSKRMLNGCNKKQQQHSQDDEQGNTTAMTSYLSQPPNWDDSWSSFGSLDRFESIDLGSRHHQHRRGDRPREQSMMFWHRNSFFPNNGSNHDVSSNNHNTAALMPQMQVQVIDDGLATNTGEQRHNSNIIIDDQHLSDQQQQQQHNLSYQSSAHFEVAWIRNNTRSFDDSYTISGKPIGEGGFGVVYSCVSKEDKQRKRRAVKIISAENYEHEEIEILQYISSGHNNDDTDNHNIMTMQDIVFGFDRVYVVMEEMKGDLLTRLNDKVYYKEAEARTVIHTLLDAVQFLHKRGVAHRDIKPENILVGTEDTDIKLADFGLAKRFRDANGDRLDPNMYTMCGSVWYAAPEVFGRPRTQADCIPYDERCDLWSIGIVMYLVLAGYMPFLTEDNTMSDYEVVQEVNRGRYKFHGEYWGNISLAAKQLISSLLKVHPVLRCTIQEALDCPWIVLPISAHFQGRNHINDNNSNNHNDDDTPQTFWNRNNNIMLV